MSRPDPLTLKCCYCGCEQSFEDQGQAISVWSVEENKDGVAFALCSKHARVQPALDMRTSLMMGKQTIIPPEGGAENMPPVLIEPMKALKVNVRGRFKLVSIDAHVAGLCIAGNMDEIPSLIESLDKLEIGKEYAFYLK